MSSGASIGWLADLSGQLVKSQASAGRVKLELAPRANAKGQLIDPLIPTRTGTGFYYRPTALSYEALRAIAYSTPILKAIFSTRVTQAQMFAKRPLHDFDIGMRVKLRDPNAKMTPAARKQAAYIEDFILQCGVPGRDRVVTDDNFRTFTAKVIRDSMIFDQLNFQTQYRRDGKPYAMLAMPAMSMRLREMPAEEEARANVFASDQTIEPTNPDEPRYVQVYNSHVIADFTPRELAWGVRNPVTDIDHFGYGWSEIESLIPIIQAIVWAEAYNRKFFSQGSGVKGVLNIKGDLTSRALEQFRNDWHAMVVGVENAFRTPVLASKEGIEWLEMHSTNKEMEYSEWINYLIKVICSHYQIDPGEVKFFYGNTGQSSAMFENSQEAKLKSSKDNGLRPILYTYEDCLNSHVVQPIDPDFTMGFVGIDADDEKDKLENTKKYVSTIYTVDEGRALYGKPPLPNGEGKVILDPTWMQNRTQLLQQKAAAAGQGLNPGESFGDAAGGDFNPDDFGQDGEDKNGDGLTDEDPQTKVDAGADQDTGQVETAEVQKSLARRRRVKRVVRVTTIEV